MSVKLILEFGVIIGALLMGARAGGVALGLWGAVGLLVLVVGFGVPPGALPGEVLLIVLTVIMAASAMEVAGIVAGACGNAAILGYANKLTPTDRPDIAYAMIFPGMTIVKILFVDIIPALF